MNREFLHKITILGCLFLLITSSSGTDNGFQTPEQYAQIVQEHFANEEWEAGKELLEEGLQKYPNVSDLEWLMGKYWFHEKNYDQSRYHLVKAIDDNYNNVNAKHLLVDVEDITENYSSAICYVNELLEVNPYWRGLWRRKIELYRKQNNDVEADRLLKRINQIYPNDTILRKDYIYSMEVGYQQMKKGGNRKEAIEKLTELIKVSPQNEEYYLDIINLHLQEGNREAALGWSSNGLAAIPGSGALIVKRASILSELARYPEALVFIREQMRRNNSPAIRRMYNDLLMEAARAEKQRDPYVLYGMAYEGGNKNKEALDYLLNTSVTRGYTDDALFYIREAKKQYGNNDKGILYKEYMLYRQMNEDDLAYSTLKKMYEMYPDDYDITLAMSAQHMKKAEKLMELGVQIGADVPYCVMRGTALAEGIGEKLTSLPGVPMCYVLIGKPGINVSTKFVYGNLHLDEVTEHPDIDGMVEAIRNHDLYGITDRMGNVLESVTCPAYPVIDEIKAQMMKNGAVNAMMSGSGPTVFGIFDDPDKAEFARDQLKISGLSKQTFLTTVSKPGGTKYGKK